MSAEINLQKNHLKFIFQKAANSYFESSDTYSTEKYEL